MAYDENNIFAKILKGDIPCDKVYEDEFVLAFKDIHPQAPVHVLVIPKGQYTDIVDFGKNADAKEISNFWQAVSKITEQLELPDDGFRTIANTGSNGGQEVPHFHIHLLGGKKIGPMVSRAA